VKGKPGEHAKTSKETKSPAPTWFLPRRHSTRAQCEPEELKRRVWSEGCSGTSRKPERVFLKSGIIKERDLLKRLTEKERFGKEDSKTKK